MHAAFLLQRTDRDSGTIAVDALHPPAFERLTTRSEGTPVGFSIFESQTVLQSQRSMVGPAYQPVHLPFSRERIIRRTIGRPCCGENHQQLIASTLREDTPIITARGTWRQMTWKCRGCRA